MLNRTIKVFIYAITIIIGLIGTIALLVYVTKFNEDRYIKKHEAQLQELSVLISNIDHLGEISIYPDLNELYIKTSQLEKQQKVILNDFSYEDQLIIKDIISIMKDADVDKIRGNKKTFKLYFLNRLNPRDIYPNILYSEEELQEGVDAWGTFYTHITGNWYMGTDYPNK